MIFDLIYFINIVLSLLTAVYLWTKLKPIHLESHTKTLAAYFFLNAFCFSFYLIIKQGYIFYVPFLYKLPAPITYLISPAAYLHVRFLITKNSKLKPIDGLHLLPFAIFLVSYLPFYLQDITTKSLYIDQLLSNFSLSYTDNVGLIPESINTLGRILQPLVYLILQWRLVKSKEAKVFKIKEKTLYRWIYNFVGMQSLFFVSLILTAVTSIYFLPNIGGTTTGRISSIFTICFFFAISIYLFWNQNILRKLKHFSSDETRISLETSQKLEFISKKVFEEKLFKNKDNSIMAIATSLGLSKKDLSNLINTKHTSFNVWINDIKINQSIALIKSSYLDDYSIDALAAECGFKSKATFYRAFKTKTGMTPYVFLKTYLKDKV